MELTLNSLIKYSIGTLIECATSNDFKPQYVFLPLYKTIATFPGNYAAIVYIDFIKGILGYNAKKDPGNHYEGTSYVASQHELSNNSDEKCDAHEYK
ncbi:hypothetical protein Cyrtocomes_00138 [Candidatus Cyrtobacter comes]|uniref:Uncharacterized protein n=1 Tax=Candidatus Cyrtobacter comes TaxID=675776 RepID=A0ABU5L7B1_9RICK|nr:hypothetical protein [Candidatus Cyrtobacter comes]MDZ5761780.1 hypothetical protein [Candidatus Cyrtobacter comes]